MPLPFDAAFWPIGLQLGAFEIHWPDMSVSLALAIVATLGYLFGRRNRESSLIEKQSRREARRAQLVARELERVAATVRKGVLRHQTSLNRFRDRLAHLGASEEEASFKELCREAEAMVGPTLRLAGLLADAYDQIRQQTAHLMTFTELRTDPLTGASNRRGMDEALNNQLAMSARYKTQFSIVLLDIDHFKKINDEQGHLQGDRILQKTARVIDEAIRETDVLARFGGEEFMIILPQTDLAGAGVFGERVRTRIAEQLPVTTSGGVATVAPGDTAETLLARADAALYRAKSAGRNRIFYHNGSDIAPINVPETASVPSA